MKIEELNLDQLRDALRYNKNVTERIPSSAVTGEDIVRMNKLSCIKTLRRYGIETFNPTKRKPVLTPKAPVVPSGPAPVLTPPAPAASADPLGEMIAERVKPFLDEALSSSVSQEQFDELAASSAALEERLNSLSPKESSFSITITKEEDGSKTTTSGVQHKSFELLLEIAIARLNAYLPGPAGSGKTTAAAKVAAALGLEFGCISVCLHTPASALLGYNDATGNYNETEFRRRYEQGGVFLLDEIDAGNPNVLAVLNAAAANDECAFADRMVKKHKDFILIAAANTVGSGGNAQYVGRNALDAATIDRFAFLDWGYDEDLELHLLDPGHQPKRQPMKRATGEVKPIEWGRRVQSLRKAAASLGSRFIISPRASFYGLALLGRGIPQDVVETCVIWKGIDSAERAKIERAAA